MQVLIDGDGCPVVDIAVELCRESQTILDGYGAPEIEPENRAETGL